MQYRYDGHGHSRMSDGWDTPEKIVACAVERNVHILGLSDHDTVSGLPALLRACQEANAQGGTRQYPPQAMKILPVPSVEVTTTYGHLLVALPYPEDALRFINDFPLWKKPADTKEVIEKSIGDYRALCVFLHPEAPYIDGFSLEEIPPILSAVPTRFFPFLGIEINNWMAQIFFRKRKQTEQLISTRNEQWGLAECAFTDYHQSGHVGSYSTLMEMSQLSPDAFVDAFVNRRMEPEMTEPTMGQRISAFMGAITIETAQQIKKKFWDTKK